MTSGPGVGPPGRDLLLVRHGRTSWNAERRYQGHADPPLDDVGRAQAYEAAPILAAYRPDLIVASDAKRALRTAEIVAVGVVGEVLIDARLRERGLGHWEGLTRDEVAQNYPHEYAEWLAGREVSRRGGESRAEVAERALAALHDLPPADMIVVVTHSATAMAVCNALLGIPLEAHPLGPLANCHWTHLHRDSGAVDDAGRWRLRAHNLGNPGAVLPLPVHPVEVADQSTDADA